MKVLGYVRVSVDEEEGQNQSILAQKSAIERWARGNQAKIVQIFEEPGVSGTRANRPAFRRMLAKAADPAEKIDAVVVYSMSRFSRSLRHQLEAEEILEEANVQIVSITDPMGEGEDGKFTRSLAGLINEKYAQDASKATRRNRRHNAERGFWNGGPVPFGYKARTVHHDGRKERRRLFVVEEQAEVVRLIYRMALVGDGTGPMGVRSIAAELNRRGLKHRDHLWFSNDVARVLCLPHYAGWYEDRTRAPVKAGSSDDGPIQITCPAIVSEEDRAAVAALRAKRAPRVTPPRVTNGPTLLIGVARCGEPECTSGLTIATGKGGRYSYYKCNRRVNIAGNRCPCPAIRREKLDDIVLSQLEARILEPDRLRQLLGDVLGATGEARKERARELARLRKQLTTAETAIGNLFGFVEAGLCSPRDPDFAKRMADKRSEAAGLRARIRDLEGIVARQTPALDDKAVHAFADLLRQKLRGDDPKLRKFYVNLLVSDVTVSTAGIRIRGSRAALEHAAINHQRLGHGPVPNFDREWCTSLS